MAKRNKSQEDIDNNKSEETIKRLLLLKVNEFIGMELNTEIIASILGVPEGSVRRYITAAVLNVPDIVTAKRMKGDKPRTVKYYTFTVHSTLQSIKAFNTGSHGIKKTKKKAAKESSAIPEMPAAPSFLPTEQQVLFDDVKSGQPCQEPMSQDALDREDVWDLLSGSKEYLRLIYEAMTQHTLILRDILGMLRNLDDHTVEQNDCMKALLVEWMPKSNDIPDATKATIN